MRLLLYSPNYWPEGVGIGKYNTELAEWMAKRGHAVTVITGLPHYPSWRISEDYRGTSWTAHSRNGVSILRVPVLLPRSGRVSTLGRLGLETSFVTFSWRWWLPRLLRRESFDAVVAIIPPLQDAHIPWIHAQLRRTPILLHVQDLQVDAALNLGMLPNGVPATLLRAWERAVLRSGTWVSTITAEMQERIVAKGVPANKTSVIPNWADIDLVRPKQRSAEVRAKLGAGPDQVLALYSGSVGEKQGLEVVLEAAAKPEMDGRFAFAVVGGGAAVDRLKARAEAMQLRNVVFHDVFPWESVPDLLTAADIHLVIQKREASGLVMPSKATNILASGRPMIATADAGTALHSLVKDSGAGFTAEPDNARALADALLNAATQPDLLIGMGERARAYAERELSKDALLTRFESLLQSISRIEPNL